MSHETTLQPLGSLDVRKDVMCTMRQSMDQYIAQYLIPAEDNWQPADLLPDPLSDSFLEDISELRSMSMDLPYEFWVVLIGDTITEEALPSYESWLMGIEGVDQREGNGWSQWVSAWTAEENRHGDLLNRFLYLSGRVNMREMEISTQHLITDGLDTGADRDPYRNFVYTSFQEMATNLSHRRVGTLARKSGHKQLAKICGMIAADEARHAKAYQAFVKRIFELDPSEMMLAFEDMMRKKIVMPAHMMRESYGAAGKAFEHFSTAAQQLEVYTAGDYIRLLESLLKIWDIENIDGLSDRAKKAQDYLLALPARLWRASRRLKFEALHHEFKWIGQRKFATTTQFSTY